MLPCSFWPLLFMLYQVEIKLVMRARMGKTKQRQVLGAEVILGHPRQVDAEEVHVLAELGDGLQLAGREDAGDARLPCQHLLDDEVCRG